MDYDIEIAKYNRIMNISIVLMVIADLSFVFIGMSPWAGWTSLALLIFAIGSLVASSIKKSNLVSKMWIKEFSDIQSHLLIASNYYTQLSDNEIAVSQANKLEIVLSDG